MKLAYDGTEFKGFARQDTHRTVQAILEERLSLLLRESVATVAAGRTDSGVHASAQVISFDVTREPDCEMIVKRINKICGPEILLYRAIVVDESFHARFSATGREYRYRFYEGVGRDPFRDRFAVWSEKELDHAAMNDAAAALTGEHDFGSFCRSNDRSLVRRVERATVSREGDETHFQIAANAFCHQMVRSIAGCLYEIGIGKQKRNWLADVLASKNRQAAADVASPRGLTLERVTYEPDLFS